MQPRFDDSDDAMWRDRRETARPAVGGRDAARCPSLLWRRWLRDLVVRLQWGPAGGLDPYGCDA